MRNTLTHKSRINVYNYVLNECFKYNLNAETLEAVIISFEKFELSANMKHMLDDLITLYSAIYSGFPINRQIRNINMISHVNFAPLSTSFLHAIKIEGLAFSKLQFYVWSSLFSYQLQICTPIDRFLTCLHYLCNHKYITYHVVQSFVQQYEKMENIKIKMGNIRTYTVQFEKFMQKFDYVPCISSNIKINNNKVSLNIFVRPIEVK